LALLWGVSFLARLFFGAGFSQGSLGFLAMH
jgi:hypothetical protein